MAKLTTLEKKLLQEILAFKSHTIDLLSLDHFLKKDFGNNFNYILDHLARKGWIRKNRGKVKLNYTPYFKDDIQKKYTCLYEIFFLHRSQNRWDGNYKDFTKDCKECPAYVTFNDKDHRCYVGKAWKKLSETHTPRKCFLRKEIEANIENILTQKHFYIKGA